MRRIHDFFSVESVFVIILIFLFLFLYIRKMSRHFIKPQVFNGN